MQRILEKGLSDMELRKIIPRGTSIDGLGLDAWTVAGACSHANSSLRLSR